MKKGQGSTLGILSILIVSCVVMYLVEASNYGYYGKSLWKLGVFAVLPLVYCGFDSNISFRDFFRLQSKRQIMTSLALGIGVYALIFGGYLVLKGFIDLDTIALKLTESSKITRDNFVFVAVYISFVNSLLEEFFFRGFVFLSLRKTLPKLTAYCVSGLAFSLYHVAIISDWFNPWLFMLILGGLFIAGLFFNVLNEKSRNIYNSWLVHMFANFAINTVGFLMFGML